MEQWKTIKEAPDYEVSNYGNVRTKRNKMLRKLTRIPSGYLQIGLRVGKSKTIYRAVHRLVAEAFVANPCKYEHVTHIDYNKENNMVNNLKWVDTRRRIHHSMTIDNPTQLKLEIVREVVRILDKYI